MKMLARVFGKARSSRGEAAKDILASLVLAAREDAAFRRRVMFVLNLPAEQRESLVKTAVEEMERKGEPAEMCAAFLALASPEVADAAGRAIAATR